MTTIEKITKPEITVTAIDFTIRFNSNANVDNLCGYILEVLTSKGEIPFNEGVWYLKDLKCLKGLSLDVRGTVRHSRGIYHGLENAPGVEEALEANIGNTGKVENIRFPIAGGGESIRFNCLPRFQNTDPIECAICLGEDKNRKYTRLPCGHTFHKKCIKTWSYKSDNCPLCRGVILNRLI